MTAYRTVEAIRKQLNNKKDAGAREKGLLAVQAIAQHSEVSANVEPYLLVLLPSVLAGAGDKITAVKNAAVAATQAIAEAINPNAVKASLPPLIDSLRNAQKWPEKMAALDFLDTLIRTAPAQTSLRVPDLIPVVS